MGHNQLTVIDPQQETLEQRIDAALSGKELSSRDLSALLREARGASANAEQHVTFLRAAAMDLSADPTKSANAIAASEISAQRLQRVLLQLEQLFYARWDEERDSKWNATFYAFEPRRDAAADRMRNAYLRFATELIEAVQDAQELDAQGRAIDASRPRRVADERSFQSVESLARGMPNIQPEFSMANIKLPALNANQWVWPIPKPSLDASYFAAVPMGDPRLHTDRWHEVASEQQRAALEARLREEQRLQAESDASPNKPFLGPVRLKADA